MLVLMLVVVLVVLVILIVSGVLMLIVGIVFGMCLVFGVIKVLVLFGQFGIVVGVSVLVVGGLDFCGDLVLVGKGCICVDQVVGKCGFVLVVVLGLVGGWLYVLLCVEVSVSDFNCYCSIMCQCMFKLVEDCLFGSLLVSNILLVQVKVYVVWFSQFIGFIYCLLIDVEWLVVVCVGGGWKQVVDSNCVLFIVVVDDGIGVLIFLLGCSLNLWGLVNFIGNVWEWVVSGGVVVVCGVSYISYWFDCMVDVYCVDGGNVQNDVGLCLLRELK